MSDAQQNPAVARRKITGRTYHELNMSQIICDKLALKLRNNSRTEQTFFLKCREGE